MRVLLVEDDPVLGDALRRMLVKQGYPTDLVTSGTAALAAVAGREPDVVLLDMGLPDRDGIGVCREIRERSRPAPWRRTSRRCVRSSVPDGSSRRCAGSATAWRGERSVRASVRCVVVPTREPPAPGLVIVDKDSGPTSHDVVGRLRRIMGTRKVGHAGTLDPMATGVLVVGIERATKLLGHLSLDTKAYTATVRLGQATTTDDAEGEPLGEPVPVGADEKAVRAAMAELTGDVEQVPSAVSAVKIDGVRAYKRVRDGESVEIPARPVTVSVFDLLEARGVGEFLDLDVAVECSSGTYVRALARDLGARLGVGGHLTALRRTRVGPFTLDRARTVGQLAETPGLSLDLAAAVAAAFPRRELDEDEAAAVRFGRSLSAAGIAGNYGVFAPDGTVLALMADRGTVARPTVVFAPAG